MGKAMRGIRAALGICCVCLLGAWLPNAAEALPPGFGRSIVFSNLPSPTTIAFAPDGRLFVGEKAGGIKVFDGLGDTTPTQFADLRTEVHNFWDRGLLAIALDPDFPAQPYVYVSYTYDAPIGGTAPIWGTTESIGDPCPSPPGPTDDGCVVSGRLVRLTADTTTNQMVPGSEKVLINDWCQQFPSHSIGDIAFGADGMLYMTGGDGASFNYQDWGQTGNPCGDPPGGTMEVPSAEGGALRAQDIRTGGDPLGLNGSLIRVDPSTGRPVPDPGPDATESQLNQARIQAYGFRNPFRIAIRPGTNEGWVGDVGWDTTEEIDRVTGTTQGKPNFGWPCFEGIDRRYDARLSLCSTLGRQAVIFPYFSYQHGLKVEPTDPCPTDLGSDITGLEFYDRSDVDQPFPPSYDGALFFADHSRRCVYVMKAGADGLPDPATATLFDIATGSGGASVGPVDLEVGPDGALYYPMLGNGQIARIAWEPDNRTPTAQVTATPDHGAAPLSVHLDASGSTDPDAGDQLEYAWDLDADGAFDDATGATVDHVYAGPGSYRPSVRVSDPFEAFSMADTPVEVGARPIPEITAPQAGRTFHANEAFTFSGAATDAEDGDLPASALDWSAVLNHCEPGGGCHEHPLQDFEDTAGGELALPAHERPYYLTLTLIATDADGLKGTTSLRIDPQPNAPPVPAITTPASGGSYSAGERIAYAGTASDREDGKLSSQLLSWKLLAVRCSGGTCSEDEIASLPDGAGGELTAPRGTAPERLRLALVATDLEGATARASVGIDPSTVEVAVASRRDRARIGVDGKRVRAPYRIDVLRGSSVRLAGPLVQGAPGRGRAWKLRWRRWSDGGDRRHVVTPLTDATYRVSFALERRRRR
jgi:glucose/arabinose dehydrogenase